MDRKKLTTHALAVLAGAALVSMLGAGQPAAKVCVGVAVGREAGGDVVYRAFSDGSVEWLNTKAIYTSGQRQWAPVN